VKVPLFKLRRNGQLEKMVPKFPPFCKQPSRCRIQNFYNHCDPDFHCFWLQKREVFMIPSSIVTIPPPCFMLRFLSSMSRQNYLVKPIPYFRLFGPLNDSLREQHYTDDEALHNAVIQWLKMDSNFYQAEVHVLVKGGR
jgi:hypothetical protein